jgi:phage N-6-adenine-methyltransferase
MPQRKIYETDADRQRAYRKRKKAARLTVHFQSLLDVRATPLDLFNALDREFGFETDVCALPYNAKCARYFSPEVNGLAQEWQGVCFMNPPYGREMGAWLQKALESARAGATVVGFDNHWNENVR